MVLKAQKNPSTLKVIKNPITGKIQAVNTNPPGCDCQYCSPGKTPKYLIVRLSDFVICTNCYPWESTKSINIISPPSINGDWIIQQQGGAPYYDCCMWAKWFDVSCEAKHYDTTDCSGTGNEFETKDLKIEVYKLSATSLQIQIMINLYEPGWDAYYVLVGCSGVGYYKVFTGLTINDCMNLSGILIGDCNSCSIISAPGHVYGGTSATGKIQIKEGTVW